MGLLQLPARPPARLHALQCRLEVRPRSPRLVLSQMSKADSVFCCGAFRGVQVELRRRHHCQAEAGLKGATGVVVVAAAIAVCVRLRGEELRFLFRAICGAILYCRVCPVRAYTDCLLLDIVLVNGKALIGEHNSQAYTQSLRL